MGMCSTNLVENDISRDFWKEIEKLSLANDRKTKIPTEVLDPEGYPVFDCEKILEKWKCDYSALYNTEHSEHQYSPYILTIWLRK